MKRLIIFLVAITVIGVAVVPFALAGAKHKTYAPEDCTKPKVKPNRIVFFCADFGAYINDLHWGHWGGHRARGSGVFHEKVCKPDCASGRYRDYHASIRLRKPRVHKCGGRRVPYFHSALLRFPNRKPPDVRRVHKNRLACAP